MKEFELVGIQAIKEFIRVRIQKDETALNSMCNLLQLEDEICVTDRVSIMLNYKDASDNNFWEKAYEILLQSFFRPLKEEHRNLRLPFHSGAAFYTKVLGIRSRTANLLCRKGIEPGMLIPVSREDIIKLVYPIPFFGDALIQEIIERVTDYKKTKDQS